MYRHQRVRGAGFEVAMPNECPTSEQPKRKIIYRPDYQFDESGRKELARQWIARARGKDETK